MPRKHLICRPEEGGIGLINVITRAESYGVKHLRDVIALASRTADDDPPPRWFYLARYFVGRQLRRFVPSFGSNCHSHALEPSAFYKHAIGSLAKCCPKGQTRCFTSKAKNFRNLSSASSGCEGTKVYASQRLTRGMD